MPYCALRACKFRVYKKVGDTGIVHHGFPENEETRAKWADFINHHNRTDDFKPHPGSTTYSLCSIHFEKSCYLPSGRLIKDAVPTIAPKFTAEIACKYHLIPAVYSPLLSDINNFDLRLEDLPHLVRERAISTKEM